MWRGGAATTQRRVATRKAGEIWVVVAKRATTLGHTGNVGFPKKLNSAFDSWWLVNSQTVKKVQHMGLETDMRL